MIVNKALKCTLILVVMLSVFSPVVAYFGVVVAAIFAITARRSRQILSELAADKGILVMLFFTLLSGLYSHDKLLSLGGLVIICMNVGFYLVLVVELKGIGLKSYYQTLSISCTLACIYGLYQFASGNLIMPESWVDEKSFGSIVRIYSTLLNPNIFAAYLAINLSFAIARFKSVREDLLLSINILLASICLLLTYSRGGFAAFFAAMLVLCIFKERNKGFSAYMVLMITAFVAINSTAHANRVDLAVISKDSSSLYRIEIWKAAINMFLANPILGHGPGTTWYYLSSGSDKLYGYILHSHNIYLQVAAETGMLGVFAFVYLLICKINAGVRLLREKMSGEDTCLLQGFIACTAGIAVHGIIDAVIFVPALSLILMSYSAMCGRVVSEHSIELSSSRRMHYQWQPGLVQLLESKGVLKLFSGKSTGKDEYKEEEGKTCQA